MASNLKTRIIVALAASGLVGSSTFAAFDPTMYQEASDPSTWAYANLIQSLDAASTGFNYNFGSGFAWEFFGVEQDRTDVISEVYQISQTHTFTTGASSITLNPGDLAFVYRVRLVESNGATVTSLTEAQVIGAPLFGFGQDVMDASLILGQGYINGAYNPPTTGNIDDAGTFGSSVDFQWPGNDVSNLDNNQTAVLIMFTSPALIGQGVLNLTAPAGQTGGLTGIAQAGEAPPILIPLIPAPGAASLGVIALGFGAAGRRRRKG